MRFDFNAAPPPITVNTPEGPVTLLHSYLTATERARAVEALSRGVSLATEYLWEKIGEWTGVTKMDGQPISMIEVRENGEKVSRLDAFMGRLPFVEHLRVVAIQLALNGVRLPNYRDVFAEAVQDKAELATLVEEMERFFSSPGGRPTDSSASSSTTATSPMPSA